MSQIFSPENSPCMNPFYILAAAASNGVSVISVRVMICKLREVGHYLSLFVKFT